jgi:hypothetical protein
MVARQGSGPTATVLKGGPEVTTKRFPPLLTFRQSAASNTQQHLHIAKRFADAFDPHSPGSGNCHFSLFIPWLALPSSVPLHAERTPRNSLLSTPQHQPYLNPSRAVLLRRPQKFSINYAGLISPSNIKSDTIRPQERTPKKDHTINRHRGSGRPLTPATSPDMRVRIRRFGGLG